MGSTTASRVSLAAPVTVVSAFELERLRIPRRIQMSRQRRWQTMPEAAVVSRPTKLGNPWQVVRADEPGWWIVDCAGHRPIYAESKIEACRIAVAMFEETELSAMPKNELSRLTGRNVACWCPIWDKEHPCWRCGGLPGFRETCVACERTGYARWPCHGDPILRAANPSIQFPWLNTNWRGG
jgi:hypothetical protein